MSTDYQLAAADYARRGVTGTDALAFRRLAERVGGRLGVEVALDLGCGAGRSTRFLAALGLRPVGVDPSEAMLAEARRRDAAGDYRLLGAGGTIPLADASVDLALSTWAVLEIATRPLLGRFAAELARVLRAGGVGFVVTNTAAFYAHRWVSCEVDFAVNAPPLRSGQRVRARLMPEGVVVDDTYWSDEDYRETFADAGLAVAHAWRPLAPADEPGWYDETTVAPWVIYELGKPGTITR